MHKQDYEDLHALEEHFWWFAGMREVTAALLDPLLPAAQNRSVLDAGCGTGLNLSWLKKYSPNSAVVGIDFAADALAFCRARGERLVTCASVIDLPFADSSFDVVTSFDVLVQLPGEGADGEALREMYRVLRPGGILFVRVAAYDWMKSGHDRALSTQRRYQLPVLRERIEEAGFRVLRSTYANSLLFPGAFLRRLVLKPIGLVETGSDVKPLPPNLEWLNRMLFSALSAEARWLKKPGNSLPAGLSAICVAQKPSD